MTSAPPRQPPAVGVPNSTPVAAFTERELIGRITGRLPPPPAWMLVGIGDDAAVVEPERSRAEVLTVDALVEGVHFDRAFTPPGAIGHRALAANLSDLAAMGAAPRLALLSMAIPPGMPVAEFDAIADGIARLAARHRVHLAGGNLTSSPGPLVVDITAIGTVKRRQALTRAGARAGDDIYVSGTIGAAAAGLQALRRAAAPASSAVARFLYPEPRVRLGVVLARNRAATACMDLSDGLADAIRQVAEASGVGAILDAEAVPIDPAARAWFESRGADPVHAALAGGDDYELLVAVGPRLRRRLAAVAGSPGAPLTRIGVFTEERALIVRRGAHDTPMPEGYQHFRRLAEDETAPGGAEGR
ncbi:MAG: thiamine-phosphate kinase [Acidobacteria bacterium]|nr:thiamine-phosphate kinase [Acidobacteriota bacterium]